MSPSEDTELSSSTATVPQSVSSGTGNSSHDTATNAAGPPPQGDARTLASSPSVSSELNGVHVGSAAADKEQLSRLMDALQKKVGC